MLAEKPYWSLPPEEVLAGMASRSSGLDDRAAADRRLPAAHRLPPWRRDIRMFVHQFRNPLTLLLVFALVLSAVMGESREAAIIFGILWISAVLSFMQERKASRAAEALRQMLRSRAQVRRGGRIVEIPSDAVVDGDIILLEAGAIVPADGLILVSEDLYANESPLTGESYPAEKKPGVCPADAPLRQRTNVVFRGTSIISGTAEVVAVATGSRTELGRIEQTVSAMPEETAFEKGIRQFGYMLMRVALLLAGIILLVNIALGKNPLDSILFALALSVGLAPEMLPAIVTITLSAGARRMAARKVIVKRLASIQNLGAIDVLCSDKTGTLTEGVITVRECVTPLGRRSERVRLYAYLNASFESGYPNPMDAAIRTQCESDITAYAKFDEVPYDFLRKRLSIVVAHEGRHLMITKGAVQSVLAACSVCLGEDDTVGPLDRSRERIEALYADFSRQGFRTLGVSFKDVTDDPVITKEDETDMVFAGFIALEDPPRPEAAAIIGQLADKRVALKIITGDNTLIARHLAANLGIAVDRVVSGAELHALQDEALLQMVDEADLFAETEPSQKERIVRMLQKRGHVVGYLGDGINDAPALKAADVGISVHNAVDVARESADMILMAKGLDVLSAGITEGRKTYLNTLKYIFITISANFGNMLSMAVASVFLPFLPLLPAQVLLTNFLSDIPALTIASDQVDEELLTRPRRWDNRLIKRFMIVFGLESSFFDLMSFGVLIWIFAAPPAMFRTAWFVESVITEILILLIIRTHRIVFRSRIGTALWASSILAVTAILVIPYLPGMTSLGFAPLPAPVLGVMILIAAVYGVFAEITKRWLFRKMDF